MKRRGFFTTPSWSRSAVAMSLVIGGLGFPIGTTLLLMGLVGIDTLHVPLVVVGAATVITSAAALATGLRGVRAWQHGTPLPVAWYWPGIAGGVLQGTVFAGGLVLDYALGGGPMATVPIWLIGVTMLALGGIPYLGALCCAGAWWVERERATWSRR